MVGYPVLVAYQEELMLQLKLLQSTKELIAVYMASYGMVSAFPWADVGEGRRGVHIPSSVHKDLLKIQN